MLHPVESGSEKILTNYSHKILFYKYWRRKSYLGVAWRHSQQLSRNPGRDRPGNPRLRDHSRKELHGMKRSLALFSLFVVGSVIGVGALRVRAQGPPGPERQAAIAKQLALEAATPKLEVTEEVLPLMI